MAWYTLNDIARKAGLFILPKEGAWVCIMGVPVWPRGKRLIAIHREIGIQHMDIYWASKETLVARPIVNRFRRRRIGLPTAIAHDISQGYSLEEAMARAVEDLRKLIRGSPGYGTAMQVSLITISHPHPEEVRFFNGEVRVLTADTIRLLLESNGVDVIAFGQTQRPMLEDAAREIVDAFRVDGLSYAEAYQQVVGLGVIEPDGQFVPQWFYRSAGEFRAQFCEEAASDQSFVHTQPHHRMTIESLISPPHLVFGGGV